MRHLTKSDHSFTEGFRRQPEEVGSARSASARAADAMEQAAPSPTDILFLRETSDHAISAPAAGHGENDLLHELRDTLQELKQALHTALLVRTAIAAVPRGQRSCCLSVVAAAAPPPPPPGPAATVLSTIPLLSQGSRSGSKEARQWLLNSIAALDLQDTSTKRRRFAQFLPRGAACHGAEHAPLCRAMLQLLFEAAPTEVRRNHLHQFQ